MQQLSSLARRSQSIARNGIPNGTVRSPWRAARMYVPVLLSSLARLDTLSSRPGQVPYAERRRILVRALDRSPHVRRPCVRRPSRCVGLREPEPHFHLEPLSCSSTPCTGSIVAATVRGLHGCSVEMRAL
jgi:hypothetical protein